jgi:predicted phosphodiesterase
MSTLTWLHLSDLHFCTSEVRKYNAEVVLSELLKDVKGLMAEKGLKPDLVFCTGDIAFSGQEDEYKLAGDFFDRLLEATGHPGQKERLFLVPGNHDVNWDLITFTAVNQAESLNDRDAVTQILLMPESCRVFLCRLDNYADFVNTYFLREHLAFDDEHYFYVRPFEVGKGTEKIRIAVLGLNSAWLAHGGDKDQVVVGEIQAKKDFDREDVRRFLERGCHFILMGHRHNQMFERPRHPDRDLVLIPAGATYEGREKTEINAYNLVRLDLAAGRGTIYLREYSYRAGRWVPDYRTWNNPTYTFDLPDRLRGYAAVDRAAQRGRITIMWEGIPGFGASKQNELITLVAGAVPLERERIQIVRVWQESVRIELELPAKDADTLVNLIRTGRFISALTQLIPPESTPSGEYTIKISDAEGTIIGMRVARYYESLLNRERELELFQQILQKDSPVRGVVVHSRGERGWGKSSLLRMFCQECSKCDPRFAQALLFLNQEAPVGWDVILEVTARGLGLVHFPKYFALAQSMVYSKAGPPETRSAVFGYGGEVVSGAEYRTGEIRMAEITMELVPVYGPTERFQEQLTDVFLEELEALPEPAQIVWLVDTTEVAGPETQTWLSNMLGRIASQQTQKVILVVAGRKPLPYDDAWKNSVCELDLKGLPREAIRQIAESRGMRGTERTMEKLAELLEEKTSGNPLSVCSYLDSELPRVHAERW